VIEKMDMQPATAPSQGNMQAADSVKDSPCGLLAVLYLYADGGRFHAGFMLHDPHASRVVPVLLPETAYTNAPKLPPTYDVKVPVMLSSLAGFTQVGEA
jgi:hypothetical protein